MTSYALKSLFPKGPVQFPTPFAQFASAWSEGVSDEKRATVLTKFPTGEEQTLTVGSLSLPLRPYALADVLRLALPKVKGGTPLPEVKDALAAELTKLWGEPFESKKKALIWLDEKALVRADLYAEGQDGVFLEVGPYTPFVSQVQLAIDAVKGNVSALPVPGTKVAEVKKKFPGYQVEDTRIVTSVRRTELSTLPTWWQGDLEGDVVRELQFGGNFTASSKKPASLLKAALKGLDAKVEPAGTTYSGAGPLALFVSKFGHVVLKKQ